MAYVKDEEYQTKLCILTPGYNIPFDHISRFVVDFIDERYELLGIPEVDNKSGRYPFNPRLMLRILIYAELDKKQSTDEIEELLMYHDVYRYVSGGIIPSSRTLRRYRDDYRIYYNQLLQMTLKEASDCGFTEFEHVIVDGSINKAHNSKNNVITRKETQILIDYLIGVSIDSEELNKLHKTS